MTPEEVDRIIRKTVEAMKPRCEANRGSPCEGTPYRGRDLVSFPARLELEQTHFSLP